MDADQFRENLLSIVAAENEKRALVLEIIASVRSALEPIFDRLQAKIVHFLLQFASDGRDGGGGGTTREEVADDGEPYSITPVLPTPPPPDFCLL